ncbi:MAG: MlaD family protein [Bacteroidetes bacterium]|nr:MlaD family protein [Bacteroidota bacterium]
MKIPREAKIGLFTLVSFTSLYFGYNFLRGKKFFSGQNTYYVVYNTIEGVNKSTPIYYKGLKVGQVEDLGFLRTDSANRIIATLIIDKNIALSKSTEARIVSTDLLGGKAISLIVPDLLIPVEKGDTIKGSQEVGIGESISGMIEPVKDKTENVLLSLNRVLGRIDEVLGSGGSEKLNSGINDLAGTMHNLNLATAALNDLIRTESARLSKTSANLESITSNIRNNNVEIDKSIHNVRQLSDSLSQAPIKQMVENLNKTSLQLSLLAEKLNKGEGSAGKLLNDPQLYDNLNKSSQELKALLKDIQDYPSRYVHVSVFGGSAKKADKERAAKLKAQQGN